MLSLLASAALASSAAPVPAELAGIDAASPGCALGVIEDGKLSTARGFGVADLGTGRPITAATTFNIASMSKQFTGAAIALLIAEGTLSPDDDIRRYLPELRDYGHVIRIRHLLNHTSGLRNHMALAAFQPTGPLPGHEEALALVFRQSALNFAPGTRHQYDSPNYVLLAEIVARASGQPFERFLAKRIFEPLGMTATGFASPDLARAYTAKPGGSFALNEAVNRARGSSGLVSSVQDFARWLANYSDGKVGGAALLQRMTAGSRLDDGTPISYGYGLSVTRDTAGVPGLTSIGHGGQTAAYRSTFSYFPARRLGAVLLCNRSDAPLGAASAIVDALVKARFAAPSAAKTAIAEQPLSAAEAARFAGLYHDPVGDELRTIAADKGKLQFVYAGQPYPLAYLGDGRFALEGYGELRFEREGSAVRLTEVAADQAPIAFTRVQEGPARPLTDFAGRYRSADLDGNFEISATGDSLLVRSPAGDATLAQIHPDGFAAPEADFQHLAFTRDANGKVDGFTLTTMSGINRMRFVRSPG